MIKWKEMKRIEAIILYAAHAQNCALKREIPLTFNNWLRSRSIRLSVNHD